jgi:hypothetical protein
MALELFATRYVPLRSCEVVSTIILALEEAPETSVSKREDLPAVGISSGRGNNRKNG